MLILTVMHLITVISKVPLSLILTRVYLHAKGIVASRFMSKLMYFSDV